MANGSGVCGTPEPSTAQLEGAMLTSIISISILVLPA